MRRRPSPEAVVTFVLVAAASLTVFLALHPSKLFLNTTPAGGDMGAHVWAPQFLRHHLFPHGRITGWSPDWYNGFPALTFYFPLPYVIIAVLSYVLPYGIAFKLVSVSGLVGLPVAAWAFGRLMRMRFPGPALLGVAMVPYLFDRYWTIYGGNIASTLAGEFSFSISLALALLFLGVFNRCLETGRHRGLAALLLAATALCHLLPTLFAIVGAIVLFLLRPSWRRLGAGVVVAAVGACVAAFWLVPFALRLGYSNDMGWERTVTYVKNLFPWLNGSSSSPASYARHLEVVMPLALAGAVCGLALRRRAAMLITWLGVTFALAFRYLQHTAIWNARMLPFWFLTVYMAAAAGVAEAANALGIVFGSLRVAAGPPGPFSEAVTEAPADERSLALVGAGSVGSASAPDPVSDAGGLGAGDEPSQWRSSHDGWWDNQPPADTVTFSASSSDDDIVPSRAPNIVVAVLATLVVAAFLARQGVAPTWLGLGGSSAQHNFVLDWANWNYSGYQQKPAYPEYQDVVATMARVGREHGCGRAMWEYESEEDRFGTPMALMLLPMWTNECIGSQEGLFFESSATVPYHFLNQSELSKAPSDAMRDLPYKGLNVADGIAHLRLMGVRYYLAINPETQSAAEATPGVHLIASSARSYPSTYTDSGVSKTRQRRWEVFQIDGSDPVAALNYQPVVMTGVPTTGRGWIYLNVCNPSDKHCAPRWFEDPSRWDVMLAASGPKQWARVKGADPNPPRVPVSPAVVSNIKMSDDRISFDVDRTGSPVLVKTSYFPNWQAQGASGPWRVTPNLMVVVPTSTHVSLHYGFTPVDNAGRLLTLAGLAVAAGLVAQDYQGGRSLVRGLEGSPGGPGSGGPGSGGSGSGGSGSSGGGGSGSGGSGSSGGGSGSGAPGSSGGGSGESDGPEPAASDDDLDRELASLLRPDDR